MPCDAAGAAVQKDAVDWFYVAQRTHFNLSSWYLSHDQGQLDGAYAAYVDQIVI